MADEKTSSIVRITPGQIGTRVIAFYNARRPVFLVGPPGVGKSHCVAQAAATLRVRHGRFGFIDQRMSQRNPVDLHGVPATRFRIEHVLALGQLCRELDAANQGGHRDKVFNAARRQFDAELKALEQADFTERLSTWWGPPSWLPDADRDGEHGIFFLDELTSAGPEVQAACYQLIQDRRIGDYILPPGWIVVAAGNRAEDRAIVYQASSALNNKFGHFEVIVDWDDWRNWAYNHAIHRDVIAFNAYRKGKTLFVFDPESETTAFPSPRTWEYVSDVLRFNEDDELTAAVIDDCAKALVGEHVGAEFVAFRSLASSLPDLDAAIETYRAGGTIDWKTACGGRRTDKAGIAYVVVVGLAQRASGDNSEPLWKIASDMTDQGLGDFSVLLVLDALTRDYDSMAASPHFDLWCEKNADLAQAMKTPCVTT